MRKAYCTKLTVHEHVNVCGNHRPFKTKVDFAVTTMGAGRGGGGGGGVGDSSVVKRRTWSRIFFCMVSIFEFSLPRSVLYADSYFGVRSKPCLVATVITLKFPFNTHRSC